MLNYNSLGSPLNATILAYYITNVLYSILTILGLQV